MTPAATLSSISTFSPLFYGVFNDTFEFGWNLQGVDITFSPLFYGVFNDTR